MNVQVFERYIDEVDRRCSAATNDTTKAAALAAAYLDAVLFHMVQEVPGAAEYLERELVRLKELNDLERI